MIRVENLTKHFPVKRALFQPQRWVRAVDGVSFAVRQGETLGLVGESGCGKSTLGRCLLRLIDPTGGKVFFEEKEITALAPAELRRMRQHMQIIFQDPFSSLNPRLTVGQIVGEPFALHGIAHGSERQARVYELLRAVGLSEHHARRSPNALSGGQRQRVGIARALALNPKFVLCDEPTSALDVSVRSQILNLLGDLQERFALTYVFISHDLGVVQHLSTRVGVMYLGRLVELAPTEEFFSAPMHPYALALLSAVPVPNPAVQRARKRIVLKGDVPSPVNPPSGCRFHPRCPYATDFCRSVEPAWTEHRPGHWAACHYPANA